MLVQKSNCNLLECKGKKMNKIKHTILLLVCSFGLMCSQFANATIITSGCVSTSECSLDELVNGGGSLGIDDLAFTNWQEMVNAAFETNGNADNNSVIDLSTIFVAGIDAIATGNVNEFILGVKFFTVSGMSLPFFFDPIEEAELELKIDYDVIASGNTEITAAKLALGNRNLGSAESFVEVNLDSVGVIDLQVFDQTDPIGSVLMHDTTFASAQTSLALTSNIQTGTFVPGEVELFDFSIFLTVQTDPGPTSVPEPSGVILLLLSLTLLITTRYRKNI
jgi:hypothetical protein